MINNNNKSELKGALVLENFRSALAVNHPSATQLILAEYSNIQPQDKTPQEPLKIGFSERTTSAYMRGMMNSMSGSQINSARESLFSAFPEDRSAIITSASVGQTLEGHNIPQVHSQEPKKEGSPDSIALRKSETQGDAGNLFVGRRISFDPSLVENEKEIARAASSEPPEKAITPDAASDKKFKKCARQFKKLVTVLEIAMDSIDENDPERSEKIESLNATAYLEIKPALQKLLALALEKEEEIPLRVAAIYRAATPESKETMRSLLSSIACDDAAREEGDSLLPVIKLFEVNFTLAEVMEEIDQIASEDPERSGKVAAAYATIYPEVKDKLQSLLSSIEAGEIKQTKSASFALGAIAIQVVEVAFKRVDLKNVGPIKIQEGVRYQVLTSRQVPWKNVPFEEVEAGDIDRAIIIYKADSTIKNLREMIKSLKLSDSGIGNALH